MAPVNLGIIFIIFSSITFQIIFCADVNPLNSLGEISNSRYGQLQNPILPVRQNSFMDQTRNNLLNDGGNSMRGGGGWMDTARNFGS